jgi:putative IMPACT (imprinted ancient) family translation regulator
MGTMSMIYPTNDNGEPNNSAGMPIYGQIQSFEVTNIFVVVVRYSRGVKLGVEYQLTHIFSNRSLT